MIKRFSDYGEALAYGKEFGRQYGCRLHTVALYATDHTDTVYLVVSTSSYHLVSGKGSHWTPGGGWFGCANVPTEEEKGRMFALGDVEPLPGKGEYWYHLVACHTQRTTHEQRLAIAKIAEETDCGVWHACAVFFDRLGCECGRCKPLPKRRK